MIKVWPAVEEGVSFNTLRLGDQTETLLREGVLEKVKGSRRLIKKAFIGELPEVFRGLEFGGIARLEEKL